MASIRSDAVIALGRKLVAHLDLAGDGDLMAEWMAHDLADKIAAAESAAPPDKAEAQEACARAIQALWAYRYELTPGVPALVDLQAVHRGILALDPDWVRYRYFPELQWSAGKAEVDETVQQWLEAAGGIDAAARELIRFCLVQAAARSIDEARDWVEAAREAFGEDGPEWPSVLFLRPGEDPALKQRAARRAWLEECKARLDSLVAMAAVLSRDLTVELEELDGPISDPGDIDAETGTEEDHDRRS